MIADEPIGSITSKITTTPCWSVSLRQADRLLLRTRHDNRMAPSLPRHYPSSPLLSGTLGLPTHSCTRLGLPVPHSGYEPQYAGSPRFSGLSRYAPRSCPPAGPIGALAVFFPIRAGFSISGSLATCNLGFEAVLGSTV